MSAPKIEPARVAIFGSYHQGEAVIGKILELQKQYPDFIRLVGIATDDPRNNCVSPQRRIWRLANPSDYDMIPQIAAQNNVPVWTGIVKGDDFFQEFSERWKPDVCYMATFGQLVPARIFDRSRLGFFNFHPAVDREWPSYAGGDPFGRMIAAKEPHCSVAMHEIDETFDNGKLVAFSPPVPIGPSDTVLSMYKRTSPPTAELVHWHLGELSIVPPRPNYHPRREPT